MFLRAPCDVHPSYAVRRPQQNAARGAWILAATILGSAMPGIDATGVNVALPVLQREMHATGDATQWVVEAYSLLLSALILAGGSLGDRIGRRRVFVFGACIFALASLACAISQTVLELIIARGVQGIGGALLVPESLALITASFDEQHRGAAIGTWSGFLAATIAIGPLLGGWLVQSASWRLVFLINLPIALLVVLIAVRFIEESRDEDGGGHVDWPGAALATSALAALTYGFIALQNPSSQYQGGGAALAGIALFAAFVFVERRTATPMVPLEIFTSRDFTIANIYTFLLYAALGASLFFFPFNLINIQHYSPFAAGAALLPMILLMFVSSRWSGGLVTHIGARIPLTLGAIAAGIGFALFGFAGVGGSYWTTFFPAVLLLGIGTSTFVAPLTTTVMNAAPAEHAGTASGINNAVSRVAGLLAIALLGIVIVFATHRALKTTDPTLPPTVQSALRTDSLLSGRAPEHGIPASLRPRVQRALTKAYEIGFRDAMLLCTALAWFAAALAAVALRANRSAKVTVAA
jgi:EmrB/QacA subfamily drug resistance transporter